MVDLSHLMQAFERELVKEASTLGQFRSLLSQQAGAAGAGLGAGLAIGGLGGLGYGALRGYNEARDYGAGVGTSLMHGLNRGLSSALPGALVGGLAGGGLGLAGGAKATDLAKRLTAGEGALPAFARFGQRQVHALTGALPQAKNPKAALQAMRAGSWDARRNLEQARAAMKTPPADAVEKAKQQLSLARAKKGLEYAERAEEMGLTSLPGFAKSLVKDPRKTLQVGVGSQWHGLTPSSKAMMLGTPALSAYQAYTTPDPETGKFERAGRALGSAAGMMVAPIPLLGTDLVGRGVGHVGALAGRAIGV